jgi:CDP-diacylglycerol--serine O-phosphatidyltransferase
VRAKHILPNAITLANIVFGFLGVVAAAEGRFERACVLLFLAALCDMLDGRIARWLDATSKFGMELDSLSDATSFGFAPALLIYFAVLRELGWVGMAVSILYALCGVLRLARFNTDTKAISKVTFLGCPIPCAGGYLVTFVMVRHGLPLWLIAGGTAFVALGMLSTIKVPKFCKGGAPSFMLYLAIAAFIWFLVQPSALTWHVWNGWNMVMLATNYVMLHRNGYLKRPEGDTMQQAA